MQTKESLISVLLSGSQTGASICRSWLTYPMMIYYPIREMRTLLLCRDVPGQWIPIQLFFLVLLLLLGCIQMRSPGGVPVTSHYSELKRKPTPLSCRHSSNASLSTASPTSFTALLSFLLTELALWITRSPFKSYPSEAARYDFCPKSCLTACSRHVFQHFTPFVCLFEMRSLVAQASLELAL